MTPRREMRTSHASANALAVRDYLAWQQDARGRSSHTIRSYSTTLEALLDHLGHTPLDNASTAKLQEFVDRRGHAPATRAREVSVVRSLYSYLLARGLITRNRTTLLAAPPRPRKQPRAISDEAWLRAWVPTETNRTLWEPERTWLGLGMFLGLRREEMARLGPEHIDKDRGLLVGFPRKGGGDDTMPYRDLLGLWMQRAPQLRADLFSVEGCSLGQRTHPNTITNKFLHAGYGFTPHALRHSFVTNLLRCGVPLDLVTELANHSSPEVTWRYVKTGGGRLREWAAHH